MIGGKAIAHWPLFQPRAALFLLGIIKLIYLVISTIDVIDHKAKRNVATSARRHVAQMVWGLV